MLDNAAGRDRQYQHSVPPPNPSPPLYFQRFNLIERPTRHDHLRAATLRIPGQCPAHVTQGCLISDSPRQQTNGPTRVSLSMSPLN